MPELIPAPMENFDTRLTALQAAHKELEDAFIVMTHLEKKMGEVLKEQAQYVASHEARLRTAEKRACEVDERIDKLVSATGAFMAQKLPS